MLVTIRAVCRALLELKPQNGRRHSFAIIIKNTLALTVAIYRLPSLIQGAAFFDNFFLVSNCSHFYQKRKLPRKHLPVQSQQ